MKYSRYQSVILAGICKKGNTLYTFVISEGVLKLLCCLSLYPEGQ